jgi:signal transduction histidine kinase
VLDAAREARPSPARTDGRLPLHALLDALHAWADEPTTAHRAALRRGIDRLIRANGIAGAFLELDAEPLPPLTLGVGTLARRPSDERPRLAPLPLRVDGVGMHLGRMWADPGPTSMPGGSDGGDGQGATGRPASDRARLAAVRQAKRAIELALAAAWMRAKARQTAERAAALDAATRAIASILDRESVLQLIVDRVRELVHGEYAALGIVDAEGQLDRFFTSGISAREREGMGDLPRGLGLLGLITREGRSYLVPDIEADPRHAGFPPGHPAMHSFLGVPVTVRGRPVGDLYVTNRRDGRPFGPADLELVEAFARHAGIAIDNARMHERIGQLAIVEERERIGRDLHDGIIPSIYAVALALEEVAEEVDADPDEARAGLDRAIEALNLTIRDIRNFIFGLRPELLEQAGLLGGLAALADEFRLNTLVEVELDVIENEGFEPTEPVTHELLAIAREALSNVARHARATRAAIEVRAAVGGYRVTIADNGVGFLTHRVLGPGHQGLRNMRERATALGGELAVESAPGRGTRIIVTVMPPAEGGPPTLSESNG